MTAILPAIADDGVEILAIQLRAFEAEARLMGTSDIPPLTETLESLTGQIRSGQVLKAVDGERIVGSIRGAMSGSVCAISRLSVDPGRQGEGLGAALLAAVEQRYPQASRFELTTALEENVRWYLRRGYEVQSRTQYAERITLTHLAKQASR